MPPFGACGRKPAAPFAFYTDAVNPEPSSHSSSHALSNRMPNTSDPTDSKLPKPLAPCAFLSKTRSSHEVTHTAVDQSDASISPNRQPGPSIPFGSQSGQCISPSRISPLRSLTSNELHPRSSGGAVPRTRLRRYRTEPYLLALRAEIKKESGVTPRTPLKHDNPFEPHDLPLAMSRKWALTGLEVEGLQESGSGTGKSAAWAWSIDHMAALQPVDIPHQDVLHTELLKHVVSDSDEEVAQANIRRFFDDDAVHPLTPTPDSKRWPAARSDDSDSDEEPVLASVVRSRSYTVIRPQLAPEERRDAATQTDIHIPPTLDFSRYLADLRVRRETAGWPQPVRRRQSVRGSVRRRLFADEQENATTPLETPTFGIGAEQPAPPEMDVSMGFHCAD